VSQDERLKHFLLVFDHSAGRLVENIEFDERGEDALKAYADKERQYRGKRNMEIVLIGSDSFETVMLTHANYFDGTASVSKYLVGL
jgi:hypothetical protein